MASSSSSLLNSTSAFLVDRKRVRYELSRGREMADRLRLKLCEANDGGAQLSPSAQGLVGEIIETFTRSLLMLNGGNNAETDEVVSSQAAPAARGAEDSGDSFKKPALIKDRRGSYKRRRTSETHTKETTDSFEDGRAWRKYGQKKILDSKYPRHYYRCTHKYDQSCAAKKQVQQIQENPSIFRTTYEFQHTCKSNLNTMATLKSLPHNQITIHDDDDNDDSSSFIWNFQLQQTNKKQADDRAVINNNTIIMPSSPIFDYCMPRHLLSDVISNSDVYSCTESTHSHHHQQLPTDMIDGVDSSDFDDFLMDGAELTRI